ncbi:Corticoliberin [Oryzias melastigma]|uniref:Corticoliberin n=1 Tax=Oryzias melastigma TaxID=30732 RepID=A0A834BVL3_ORYME|nr:Corticoliberin [Oryzias melastigma]
MPRYKSRARRSVLVRLRRRHREKLHLVGNSGRSPAAETEEEPSLSSPPGCEMKVNVLLLAVLLGIILSLTAEGRPTVVPLSRSKPLLLRLAVNRALLQLTQHLLQEKQQLEEEGEEKGKRSDEAPLSLDLTFHLLREVLEMARAEQMVQQANNNRIMMEAFGK